MDSQPDYDPDITGEVQAQLAMGHSMREAVAESSKKLASGMRELRGLVEQDLSVSTFDDDLHTLELMRDESYGRALVIDDEPPVARVIAHALRDIGYDVTVATRAIQDALNDNYEVLVVDAVLTERINACTVINMYRWEHPWVRSYIISGRAGDQVLARACALLRADGWLEKPCMAREIQRMVGYPVKQLRS